MPDADEVLAYNTVKLIRVLDRRVGYIYYFVQTSIIFYIVVFVLIIQKQYLEVEKAGGWVIGTVLNSQKSSLGMVWDVYDTVHKPGETGAVFIPTRVLVTRGQTQETGYCESPVHRCTTGEDCDVGNELLQQKRCVNGRCMRRQWCPAEDPEASTTETHLFVDFTDVDVRLAGYVHFHKFGLDVATTDEKHEVRYPFKGANTYPIHDLLRMANIQPEETLVNGAIVLLNVIFDCNLDQSVCESHVETTNVDTKTGFNHVSPRVYYENGVRKRDVYRMYGIRIQGVATGFGKKTSFSMILLQFASAITLMSVSVQVCDLILTNWLPEKRHYAVQKTLETEEFSTD